MLRVANLRAFARLYGVVRWFHPSDAAATIDWDRFAIEGSYRVIDAPDIRALRVILTELFSGHAPTVHIIGAGEEFPNEPAIHPVSTSGLEVIAWQHKGYGDSTLAADYISKRRHRAASVAVAGAFSAALSQAIDATPYRGAHIRLRGKLRTTGHAQARLWLRVDRGEARGFFDNMAKRPVINDAWVEAEIVGTVDADATKIVFGALMFGPGTTWYDDLELSVQVQVGAWRPIEIQNSGFEALEPLRGWSPGTGRTSQDHPNDGWNVTVDHGRRASGTSSLRMEPASKIVTEELFDELPNPGETIDIDLGSGLRARVPIALYSKDNHTIGDDPAIALRSQAAPSPIRSVGFDTVAGIADVIIVWNVLEHFWPYWRDVSIDWNAELDRALADALDDRNVDEHVVTLRRLSAAAPDGHASTRCPGETDQAFPPFAVDYVEGQVVITASRDRAVERGDVIASIDGRPVGQLLAAEEALVSGSPQWRLVMALERFGRGPLGSPIALHLSRGGTDVSVTLHRIDREVLDEPSRPPIERFSDGVYYVDLARASMADIDGSMDRLAVAPGVVFDLRDRPNSNHQILSHLLTRADDAHQWLAAPRVIRPDSGSTPASWDTSGWDLPILQPHIGGRVAFLAGPGAISYSESVLGLVEHYHLGEIVGGATAGTNGDVARISEPTGCTQIFTGRRVTKLDGSRFHLIGVKPTIPVSRTIAGVSAGKDEVLEKGLAYVRAAK